jgi:hypothetical protein
VETIVKIIGRHLQERERKQQLAEMKVSEAKALAEKILSGN